MLRSLPVSCLLLLPFATLLGVNCGGASGSGGSGGAATSSTDGATSSSSTAQSTSSASVSASASASGSVSSTSTSGAGASSSGASDAGDGGIEVPSLGSAAAFTVLGGSTVTSTGATTITGDLGVSPGTALTGIPAGVPTGGVKHAGDPVAAQAQADLTIAYGALMGKPCDVELTGRDLGGMTLEPGVYCYSSSAAQLSGDLTLDAQGKAGAVFVFKIGSTLTTTTNSTVKLINGAQACDVFWQVGSSATIGKGNKLAGNILSFASVTLMTGASLAGRALARTGAVTLDTNDIAVGACTD